MAPDHKCCICDTTGVKLVRDNDQHADLLFCIACSVVRAPHLALYSKFHRSSNSTLASSITTVTEQLFFPVETFEEYKNTIQKVIDNGITFGLLRRSLYYWKIHIDKTGKRWMFINAAPGKVNNGDDCAYGLALNIIKNNIQYILPSYNDMKPGDYAVNFLKHKKTTHFGDVPLTGIFV